jgi:tetratricopeptide (TPR) repeat protein
MGLNRYQLHWILIAILIGGIGVNPPVSAQLGPLSSREHAPQARSQDELDSYLLILRDTDPVGILRDTDSFLKQFPHSELLGSAYQYRMRAFEQLGDYDGMLASGRIGLLENPDNINTLLTLAPAIANRATQDRRYREELSLAQEYAQRALAGLEKVRPPHQTPLETWEKQKHEMQCRAREVLGVVALDRREFTEAAHELQLAVQLATKPEGAQYLRLALALLSAGDRSGALTNLQRAAELGPDQVRQVAQQQMERISASNLKP